MTSFIDRTYGKSKLEIDNITGTYSIFGGGSTVVIIESVWGTSYTLPLKRSCITNTVISITEYGTSNIFCTACFKYILATNLVPLF